MTLKYLEEYRDAGLAKKYAEHIARITTRPWKIMEACGGQTHSIIKFGIDRLLPKSIELVHGPGCPVCVTPMSTIDAAIELVIRYRVILCTFGDMLRVPGSSQDLQTAKAQGGDVRMVYSPLDALKVAKAHPEKEVVFFAVGFETTAPANAMAAFQARQLGLENFSMLVSQVLVPPALEALLESSTSELDGFLAPGHVCAITGFQAYESIVGKYGIPIVVTGFEPGDILQGIDMCVQMLERGDARVENQYTRVVRREGNHEAQKMLETVFEITPKAWRGLGTLAASGLRLNSAFRAMDAEFRFGLNPESSEERTGCRSGLILQGALKPDACPEFGKTCHPDHPLGATMVSTEGACAAYYRYRYLTEKKL